MDQATFRNPPKSFRAVPFWSWNDDLEPEELVRQIGLMDEAGWGGFFMHARVGLVTPYMSERWMECIKAAVEEARRRGMAAYLYDEDKWPSGFAGGLVPAQREEYRDLALVCKVDNKPAVIEEAVGLFRARLEEGQLRDFQPITHKEVASLDWRRERLVQFYPLTSPLGIAWFNDYSYIDLLNPEAVQAFIKSTHEAYYRELANDFGAAVPGIFTDEPTYNHRILAAMDQVFVPWTIGFEDYFRAQNGYEIVPRLPDLFFDTPSAPKTRYDFWRTLTRRFLESFSKPMFDWCQEHNLKFTGHYMAEDTLRSQVEWIGAAMPHYEYQHIPGIDKLRRDVAQPVTVKQLDSAACQLGRKRTLCEAYGCAGQNFAFAGRKWIGNWLYVLGVNLLNPHLSLYSMRGARKRDYPANLHYQQPWWPYNKLAADYFARLSYSLTQGQRVVDVLLIHPIGSAWSLYSPLHTLPVDELNSQLEQTVENLLAIHRDFHFGDEMLMEKFASCAGSVLQVGEMAYRAAIVPPGVTLASATVRLLHEFAAGGGLVIGIRPLPTMIDGEPAEDVLPDSTVVIDNSREELEAALEPIEPDVVMIGGSKVWYHHRRIGDRELYFLANTDCEEGSIVTARLKGEGRLEEWDPATGQIAPIASSCADGYTTVTLDFPPAGSHLLVIDPSGESVGADQPPTRVVQEIPLATTWDYAREDPNALTLDYAQYILGEEGDWSERLPVWKVFQAIERAGLGSNFSVRYTFNVARKGESTFTLVLESPEKFAIKVNGQPVAYEGAGWWRDISFKKIDVTALIRGGENEIILTGAVGQDTEIEHIYIIGDFAVAATAAGRSHRLGGQSFEAFRPDFEITDEAPTVCAGDLVPQGLPFFAGTVALTQKIVLPALEGRVWLTLDRGEVPVVDVVVNGRSAGQIIWPPHELEVTDLLREGENEITLRLVSSLRNLLGPHHQERGDNLWVGPREFSNELLWTDDYWFVPFGVEDVRLVVRK